MLKENGFGLRPGEENIGKCLVNGVCDCLYYILPHLETLNASTISLLDLFKDFASSRVNYNDPTHYKNKVKPLEKNKIK